MPSQKLPNAYYTNPQLGGAFSALAGLIAGDGGAGLSQDAANYATARNRDAEAMKTAEETTRISRANAALAGLGDRMKGVMHTNRQMPILDEQGSPTGFETKRMDATDDEIRQSMFERLADIATAYPNDAGAAGKLGGAYSIATGRDTQARIGATMSGHPPGKDFALDARRADSISARDAAEQQRLRQMQEDGLNARERLQEGGRNSRNTADIAGRAAIAANTPINAAPGNRVIVPPTHYAATPENAGTIDVPGRPQSVDQVLGEALSTLPPEERQRLAQQKAGSSVNINAANVEGKLRDDFNKLPVVKSFRSSQPILDSMTQSAAMDDRFAHLDLVYGLAKIMDPESVVREGEQATIMKSATIPDNLKAAVSKVFGGAQLTPATRAQIIALANRRVTQIKGSHDFAVSQFTDLSRRQNVDPRNVILDVSQRPQQQPAATAASGSIVPVPGEESRKTIGGKNYVKVNGQWFEQ